MRIHRVMPGKCFSHKEPSIFDHSAVNGFQVSFFWWWNIAPILILKITARRAVPLNWEENWREIMKEQDCLFVCLLHSKNVTRLSIREEVVWCRVIETFGVWLHIQITTRALSLLPTSTMTRLVQVTITSNIWSSHIMASLLTYVVVT